MIRNMTRTVDVDMECRCKKLSTALNKFFKKYPSLNYWRETLESMAENKEDFLSDTTMADGTKNNFWRWALHLDIEDNYYYIAVIERA